MSKGLSLKGCGCRIWVGRGEDLERCVAWVGRGIVIEGWWSKGGELERCGEREEGLEGWGGR